MRGGFARVEEKVGAKHDDEEPEEPNMMKKYHRNVENFPSLVHSDTCCTH